MIQVPQAIVNTGGAAATGDRVGVIGATSLVGHCLLPLLVRQGRRVLAFSRQVRPRGDSAIQWRQLGTTHIPLAPAEPMPPEIHDWICLAPIWALAEHFELLSTHNARRIVALSSTSRFTKLDSPDPDERTLARKLDEGERCVMAWAEGRRMAAVIFRPTLIYGCGKDQNVSRIARFIRRFGFFAVCKPACGLRQPVHAEDVAMACLAALEKVNSGIRCYNLSGGETLTYRAMVCRIFSAFGKRPALLALPLWVFRAADIGLRFLAHRSSWFFAVAQRMNQDLVFDHREAQVDLGFNPRPFSLIGDFFFGPPQINPPSSHTI